MTGTVYTVPPIPPDAEQTTYVDAGALSIGIEWRHLDQSELEANYEGEAMDEIQANITAKRLANIKSDLAAALKHVPAVAKVRIRDVGFSPAWQSLRESLKTDWQRYTLARLARYCSTRRIPPERVSDDVINGFRAHLEETQIAKSPDKVIKITLQTWNGMVKRKDRQLPHLTCPRSGRYRTPPLSVYPASFQAEVDAWTARLSHVDLWDEDGPAKPLRETSLRNHRAHIRQFAAALVEAGMAVDDITSL
jgi:hypothetical protein